MAGVPAHGAGNGFAPPPVAHRDEVIGYLTTSTDAWSDTDEGSAAAIEATCEDSAWGLLEIVCDRENGRTVDRPGLNYALERIADGRARGLVVSELQRLTRSPADLGALMAWFRDANATLVALDLKLDTSTPAGRQVASTLIALDNGERRSAQAAQNGVAEAHIHGRPTLKDHPELIERISTMRSANLSLQQIADQLNAESIPTLRGGKSGARRASRPRWATSAQGRATACHRCTTEGGESGVTGTSGGPNPTGTCQRAGARSQGPIAHPPLDTGARAAADTPPQRARTHRPPPPSARRRRGGSGQRRYVRAGGGRVRELNTERCNGAQPRRSAGATWR